MMLPSKSLRDQSDRIRECPRNIVGREKSIAVAKTGQVRAMLTRAVNQLQLRIKDHHAGAFGAYQCARYVEPSFGQQFIEVVTGDAPGNLRKLRADEIAVLVANRSQLRVDLAAASPLLND